MSEDVEKPAESLERPAPRSPAVDDAADQARRERQERRLRATWETPGGWRYWSSVNNSDVGVWYTLTSFAFLLFGGVLGLIIRAQLAVPGNDLVSAGLYNQVFTLHGTVMMFLFAIPIFEAVSILVLPQFLAARDLPFPRLSAFGYWSFLLGGIFVCGSIFFNSAPDGGWFMYPPLTTDPKRSGIGTDIWLLGLSFIEVASIAAAVELIVGVLKCRPPGMRLNLIPLYAWYILVVAVMILFAFPPLIAGDILFELERLAGWPFFDPKRGGDPLLWQHIFWIFGHPEVYIIFLPAIAVIAMIVPTFAQRPLFGYAFIILAAVGTGFISFGLWVHHMFATGMPALSLGFFSAASEVVAIPTGVQIFAILATLLMARRVIVSVPMLFAFGALVVFVMGGLTGVMVALAPFDWQAHDTYFIVAHLHYTVLGGMLFPIFGAIYYYFPLVSGKMLSERAGKWSFWLMFAGFHVTFLPMHLSGLRGMPRRVFTYSSELGLDALNLVSSLGSVVFAAGVLATVWEVLRPRHRQPYAPRNPWNAGTLEWAIEMPGEPWGIRSVPQIETRYPLWHQTDFLKGIDEGRCYLPDAEEGKRETLITSIVDAHPVQCLRVPGNAWLPMLAALSLGGVFILTTFHLYRSALVAGVLCLGFVLAWLWRGTAVIPEKPEKEIGLGIRLPLYMSGVRSVGWWAMFITMMGDLSAFATLIFAYFYYWTIHPDFLKAAGAAPGLFWPGLALLAFLAAWAATLIARRWNGAGRYGPARGALAAGAAFCVAGCACALTTPYATGMAPETHVYPAIVCVLLIWLALHGAAGFIMQAYAIARSLAGRMSAVHDIDMRNVALYWHFTAITALLTVATVSLVPLAN